MISKINAMSIALKRRNETRSNSSRDLVVSGVEERPKSWVVFFDSRDFIENGNRSAALIGCAPVVVSKTTGEVALALCAESWEKSMRRAEAILGVLPE
jgi:hypothetical protein